MLYELILINEIEQRAKIIFFSVDQGAGTFPSKTNAIHLIGSDVGSKWWMLYSLLHPTTERLNRLIWYVLSCPAPESTQWRTALRSLRASLS